MDPITIIGAASVISAGLCIAIGVTGAELAEGSAVSSALHSIAQQPDETGSITRVLFVSLAMLESGAIYSFVVTILILYFNPFWNYAVEMAAK